MLNVKNLTLLPIKISTHCAQLVFYIQSLILKSRNLNLLLLKCLTHFDCLVALRRRVLHSFSDLLRRLNGFEHLQLHCINSKVQTVHPLTYQLQLFVHLAQGCPMFELCLNSSFNLALPKLSELHDLVFKDFLVVAYCNVQLLFIYEKSVQPSMHYFHFGIQLNLVGRLSGF